MLGTETLLISSSPKGLGQNQAQAIARPLSLPNPKVWPELFLLGLGWLSCLS